MQILLVPGGQVDVDDHVDTVHVDTAGGHVSGHQRMDTPLLELGQGACTHTLRLSPVQRGAGDTQLDELFADGVGTVLAAHEQERASVPRGDLGDDLVLVARQDLEQVVLHRAHL